ncbi:hypothetical protein [Arundinibacter roseus]|uniref:Septum formation inhibitor Maf n=1 Tax=Arundinibacter roseus TaxID=2070510 RepID=A0A4R4KGI7_9BACT|nr:hypothetical protein [Arundinibacter roseus]TDB65996.1 hypothetical protein EZE20_09545 [Arundinibacter roseus]
MKFKYSFTLLFLIAFLFVGCGKDSSGEEEVPQAFREYWYKGQAEISRYTLSQGHYGAANPGEAVLIFVTEDFRTDAQVKLESDEKRRATSVLKLNAIRRFVTGIYDYSLYSSVFTPIQTTKFGHSLKVTMSAQDWCGQTYTQLNLKKDSYDVMGRSYFEKNATEDFSIDAAWLEDELWTRLRINPESLPTGETTVIPATYAARLTGQKLEPQPAVGTRQAYAGADFKGISLLQYSLQYPNAGRMLTLIYEQQFPHEIVGWEENYTSGGKMLTTRATRTHTERTDYWTHNAPADTTLRQQLGVQGFTF